MSTATETRTETSAVRVTFQSGELMRLSEVQSTISSFLDVLATCYPDYTAAAGSPGYPVEHLRVAPAREAVVAQISYNSPFEIILYLGSVTGTFLVLARRWASVRKHLAEARTSVLREELKQAGLQTLLEHVLLQRQTMNYTQEEVRNIIMRSGAVEGILKIDQAEVQ